MQKIIPLKYKIKLRKNVLGDEKVQQYSHPEYLKNRLEEEFKLSEHIADNKKIFVKKHNLKYISLEEPIEIVELINKKFIFIKFKYGDDVAENDNGKIVDEGEVIQIIENKGALLKDFYFGMEFKVRNDLKFLIIEGLITIIQKSNEQMKSQILSLFTKVLFPQDKVDEKEPEYILDFKFEEEELINIREKVKGLELITEFKQDSELDQAEVGSTKKNIPIKISLGGGMQDELFNSIRGMLSNIPGVQKIIKRAVIKQGKSFIRSNFSSDGLILSLKDSFLYSDYNIEYDKFKQETYKYICPGVEFEN